MEGVEEADDVLTAVVANSKLPAVTAQDVGRDLYYGRVEIVQIIGDEKILKRIAWILKQVPDLFEVRFQRDVLVVTRAASQALRQAA